MTLCNDDIRLLSDEWYYLLKYDGTRRVVFIWESQCYLIDRNNNFEFIPAWGDRFSKSETLVLDGELLRPEGGDRLMKIFDILYLNGNNVETKIFSERMKILSEYWMSGANTTKLWWGICSTPYKLSQLLYHVDPQGGGISKSIDGFDIDGIVLMQDVPYRRGTFKGCLKYKNIEKS